MLERNRRAVQDLSGVEVWLFILGRVLVAFAIGALAMKHFPSTAGKLVWPTMCIGLVALAFAMRGLMRRPKADSAP